ncbi:YceH family protein [Vibrio aestuarianus]|uniref:YceH family protein n=1 Tax=Vibrio aestuarianus TaxID=28171 RepID=UPI00237CFDD4|nr:YceH family protein [Vibrio aestuarianus]MDE1333656.1 YceH family protein [Vibrio aestuarianus]
MNIELSPLEARIIGCLIEKEVTTPDHYPLTLNSLTTACNQKSNREPVLSLSDAEVQDAVEGLVSRRLVSDESAFNSRVSKYQHRFCNTEFGDLKLTEQELGLVCCMLLRGAQTPGELRTRTGRLCNFTDVKEVEAVLDRLASRESGALAVKLPREPGKRESRYQHLFSGEVDIESLAQSHSYTSTSSDNSRIDELEQEVNVLKTELADLRALVESLI